MGTWGEGNFDSDGALDYLGELTESLVGTVEEVFADKDRLSLDEDAEGVIMPVVAILSMLCKNCNAAPPKEKTVLKWHKKYLQVYDRQIDGLLIDPKSPYKKARRKVIDNTFKELEKLARRFWKQ